MNGGNELVASLREGVEVRTVGAEVLVYDPRGQRTHALDAGTADLLQRCDGSTSVDEIVSDLAQAGAASPDVAVAALLQLEALGLVELHDVNRAALSRRRVMRRAAAAGAIGVAVPLIQSVVAPSIAAAQSGGTGGDPDPDPGPVGGGGAKTFGVRGNLSFSGPSFTELVNGSSTLTFTEVGGTSLTGTWSSGPVPGDYNSSQVLTNASGTISWSDGSVSAATASEISYTGLPASRVEVTDLAFTSGPFSSTVSFSFVARGQGLTADNGETVTSSTTYFSWLDAGTATVVLS